MQDALDGAGGGKRPGFDPGVLGGVDHRDFARRGLQLFQRQVVGCGQAADALGFFARVGRLPVELPGQEQPDLLVSVEDRRADVLQAGLAGEEFAALRAVDAALSRRRTARRPGRRSARWARGAASGRSGSGG